VQAARLEAHIVTALHRYTRAAVCAICAKEAGNRNKHTPVSVGLPGVCLRACSNPCMLHPKPSHNSFVPGPQLQLSDAQQPHPSIHACNMKPASQPASTAGARRSPAHLPPEMRAPTAFTILTLVMLTAACLPAASQTASTAPSEELPAPLAACSAPATRDPACIESAMA
jgi:hypothetical protein